MKYHGKVRSKTPSPNAKYNGASPNADTATLYLWSNYDYILNNQTEQCGESWQVDTTTTQISPNDNEVSW